MAPEQMRDGRDVDARADIWSLGVMLYELLAGANKTPFDGNDLPSVATHVHLDPPVPLSQYRPDVPPQLWAIVQQCLEKPRERRWPSCAELAAALVPFGPARAAQYAGRVAAATGSELAPLSGPTVNLVQGAALSKTAMATATTGVGTSVVQPKPGAPARRALAAVAVLTALAGVGLVAWRVQVRAPLPAMASSGSAEAALPPPPVVAPPATAADAGETQPEADAGAPPPAATATATADARAPARGLRPAMTKGPAGKPAPAEPTAVSQPPAKPSTTGWGL